MPRSGRSDLPDLHVFATIARRRSFRLAAIELGVTASALSHRIKNWRRGSASAGHRADRTVMPIPIGERLAERLGQGFEMIEHALGEIETYRANPADELRINAPRGTARLLIVPGLAAFTATYSNVQAVMAVDDRPIDIVAEGFVIGIGYGGTVPEHMVAMPLTAPHPWVVVGSPAYLASHGRPRAPADLLDHACIRFRLRDNSVFRWELGDGDAMLRLDVKGPFASQ